MLYTVAQVAATDAGWTVTTWIALAGALISVVTLVVTTVAHSRRERTKWARETLAEAFFDFVNSSYDAGQAVKDHYRRSAEGAGSAELQEYGRILNEQQDRLIHIQTRIRLLAPDATLQSARQVRRRIEALRSSLAAVTTSAEHQRLVDAVADAREDFVRLAKSDMSLPR